MKGTLRLSFWDVMPCSPIDGWVPVLQKNLLHQSLRQNVEAGSSKKLVFLCSQDYDFDCCSFAGRSLVVNVL